MATPNTEPDVERHGPPMAGTGPRGAGRVPAFPISKLPGGLPRAHVPEDVDIASAAEAAVALVRDLAADKLVEDALWRDVYALTGTTRTFHSRATVAAAWGEVGVAQRPYGFALVPRSAAVMRPAPGVSWLQAGFTFRTAGRPVVDGKGMVRVVPGAEGGWRIWLLVSMLDGVPGLPSADVMAPRVAPGHGAPPSPEGSPRASSEGRDASGRPVTPAASLHGDEDAEYDCIVVGAGPSGLSLAGHLQALNMRYAIVDKNEAIGGGWTSRYNSVNIHTSRSYGQLPFGNVWGPEYPYHLKPRDLVEGYERYVKEHGINLMLSTELEAATFDQASLTWTLRMRTRGELTHTRTRHLVMALGAGGRVPKMPDFANRAAFRGELLHSASYKSATRWAGKRGVVIGSANTAHDICNDMLEAGLSSVTMVQRGRTPVIPIQCWSGIYDPIYNDDVPVAVSDGKMLPLPTVLQRAMSMRAVGKYSAEHPELFDGLERAGFRAERNMDLYHCLYERFGGHYVDVGVSQKIVDGLIKVKGDSAIRSFTATGLLFEDGSELEADVVVAATGFEGNMRTAAEEIVGREVGAQLDDYWGVDCEGELRGAWKPIGHPNIWFTGGNLGLARFYARYLALQLKCDVAGFPLQVYDKTPGLT